MNNKIGATKMNQETKRERKPKLRFPEFRKAPEWEKKQLGEVATFYNGRAYKQEELLDQGKYKVLRVGNFFTSNNWYYSNLELDETKYCDNGDLLYAWSASFGPRIWQGGKVIYHYHIWKVVSKKDINKQFLFTILDDETEKLKSQSANGLGLLHITKGTIEGWECSFPSINEQQKIADCLSSIDELIAAQTQKLDALKAHRKGLMQQLFPAEGETLPKLRFSEFGGLWKKSTLDRLIDLQSGYAFQSEYFSDQGEKLLTPKNFTKNGYADFNEGNTKYTVEDFDPKYVCREGDLLLLLTDLTPSCELLGKPLMLTKGDGDVLLNQRIVRIIPKESIKIGFLLYFFLTESFHKRITDTATGSTVRHSSNKIISSTEIYFPPEREQQKIVDCLSSIDEQIAAQTQKLYALKVHKKGLMQQLFPSLDEVQG